MANELVTLERKYENKGLQKATNKILKLEKGIQANLFETASIIAYVENNKLYLDDGFKNVHEWTKASFNIEKSTSYNMLKIGKEYVRELTDGNGKVKGYKSNLTDDNALDYNVTQIVKMLPVSRETLPEVIEEEEINPTLSADEIAKRIKHYVNKNKPAEESKEEVSEAESEQIEADETDEATYTFPRSFIQEIYNELSKCKSKTAKELVATLDEILNK